MLSPRPTHAGMVEYTATFKNDTSVKYTDLFVKIYLTNANPAGITDLEFESNPMGLKITNEKQTGPTAGNSGTFVTFSIDIPSGVLKGESITASFETSDTLGNANYVWSYGRRNREHTRVMPITFTAVPEPASSVMAAIATGSVGLVIGWRHRKRLGIIRPTAV